MNDFMNLSSHFPHLQREIPADTGERSRYFFQLQSIHLRIQSIMDEQASLCEPSDESQDDTAAQAAKHAINVLYFYPLNP